MSEPNYPFPVSELLTMGDCREIRGWPDYLALGIGPEHIPDLIRMALDEELNSADSDSLEVWAPVHAWRALGQLRAEAAVEPLTQLLVRIDEFDDDWVGEDLPRVLGMIGPAAIPVLADYLADPSHGLWACVAAADGLQQIGQQHPDARTACIAALAEGLEQFAQRDPALNAFIISSLIDLKAVEAASVIERAYAADCVDPTIQGDWEDVQIELGLLQERKTPQPRYDILDYLFPSLRRLSQEHPPASERQKPAQQRRARRRRRARRNVVAKQQRKPRKKRRKRKRR